MELNQKLAEWAGFKDIKLKDCGDAELWSYVGTEPDKYSPWKQVMLPDFTISLDACFKWLVPKVKYYQINNWNKKQKPIAFVLDADENTYSASAETLALALCKAIEKLIDGG